MTGADSTAGPRKPPPATAPAFRFLLYESWRQHQGRREIAGTWSEINEYLAQKRIKGCAWAQVVTDTEYGWGLRAKKEIPEKTIIAFFTRRAPIIPINTSWNPANRYAISNGRQLYLPQPDDLQMAGLANDALHWDRNNCRIVFVDGYPALQALGDIGEGEDLCVGYGWEYWAPELAHFAHEYSLDERLAIEAFHPECAPANLAATMAHIADPSLPRPTGRSKVKHKSLSPVIGAVVTQTRTIRTDPPFLIALNIQGLRVMALVDTGASENCIRTDLALRLGITDEKLIDIHRDLPLCNADGAPLLDQGRCATEIMPIQIYNDKGAPRTFHLLDTTVLSNLAFSIILGTPFLDATGLAAHVKSKMLLTLPQKLRDAEFFPMKKHISEFNDIETFADRHLFSKQLITAFRALDQNGFVHTLTDVEIPPNVTALIQMEAVDNLSGGDIYFRPMKGNFPYGLDTSEGLYTGNIFKLLVSNTSERTLVIPARTVLGRTEIIYPRLAPVEAWRRTHVSAMQTRLNNDLPIAKVTKIQDRQKIVLPTLHEDIPSEARGEYEKLIQEYEPIFENDFSNEPWRTKPFEILLKPGTTPSSKRSFRYPVNWMEHLRILLTKYLAESVIEPSTSPWASPAFFVPKPDGSFRLVVDYRILNSCTVENKWPLPLIEELFDQLQGSMIFSKFDAHSGFYQLPIDNKSKETTAFITPLGLYQFTRLPMGVRNGPSMFSLAMRNMTQHLKQVIVYLDDTGVHSGRKEPDESVESTYLHHLGFVRAFFKACFDANLKLNGKKCILGARSTKFLGHIISEKGITPDPEKVTKLQHFAAPRSVKTLQAFIGLVGYYRQWIRNCSGRMFHMTRLLHKDIAWEWSEACEAEFQELKTILTSEPVIRHYPDVSVNGPPFILFTDASDYAIGSVLAQNNREGMEQVIAYQSRLLTQAELRYATYEKETLAIVDGVGHFDVYLKAKHFNLFTDHRSLQTILKWKNPKPRILRWLGTLQMYSFTAQYRSGAQNLNADAMSRLVPEGYEEGIIIMRAENQMIDEETSAAEFIDMDKFKPEAEEEIYSPMIAAMMTRNKTRHRQSEGEVTSKPLITEQTKQPIAIDEIQESDLLDIVAMEANYIGSQTINPDNQEVYFIIDIYFDEEETMFKAIINPNPLFEQADPALHQYVELSQIDQWNDREKTRRNEVHALKFDAQFVEQVEMEIPSLIEKHILREQDIVKIESSMGHPLLYRTHLDKKTQVISYQLIIPSTDPILIPVLIKCAHETCGHLGAERTYEFLKTRVFFAHMLEEVKKYITSCIPCQTRGHTTSSTLNIYQPAARPTPTGPHRQYNIDLIGPLMKSTKGNQYIILAVDRFSKYVTGQAIPSKDPTFVSAFIEGIFFTHGCPDVVISDNGGEFISSVITYMNKTYGIRWSYTTPYHPQANGQVERFNRTFEEIMAKIIREPTHNNWDTLIAPALHAYNISVHSTTLCTPYLLNYGHECQHYMDRIIPKPNIAGTIKKDYVTYIEDMDNRVKLFTELVAERLDHTNSLYLKPRSIREILHGFKTLEFQINDPVFVHIPHAPHQAKTGKVPKFSRYWKGPYYITQKKSNIVYEVEMDNGQRRNQHISHLKLAKEGNYSHLLDDIGRIS